jgi:peroxiredoxin Q/BCP
MPLKPGKPAPAFSLLSDTNDLVSLSDYKGQRVVLYFYPKDNTPGCTTEACEFNAALPKFSKLKVPVLGVSPDTIKKHQNFKKRYDLDFPLLADVGHVVCDAYDVWKEKLFWGRKYMGVERTTYIIGPSGKIEHVFEKVKEVGHAADVLKHLKGSSTR